MKTIKLLVLVLLISYNSFAQCYSKIVSYSRNYIALQTDGTLWAKGSPFFTGILGFGNSDYVEEFTQIGTDNDWTENISINNSLVFAIKTNGTLWVWGTNPQSPASGLGATTDSDYFVPRQVGTDTNWAKVSTGFGMTIAVKNNGTLWSWGINNVGQLGIGNPDTTFTVNVPMQVGTETNWSNIFTGNTQLVCAIKTDGTLWSWGNSGIYLGYLNATDNNNFCSPKQVGTGTWKSISVNSFGPIIEGIKTDGTLWGWGSSNYQTYYFGNGIDNFSSAIPVKIGLDSDWKEIHIGQGTIQSLKTDGTRWGWGRNTNGQQLGIGTGIIGGVVTVITQLGNDNDWKRLNIDIGGSGYGDGIKENNTLYHWGNNHVNVNSPFPTLFSVSNCTLGLEDFNDHDVIEAYPNPVFDLTNIRLNEYVGSEIQVRIINQVGQEVISKKIEIVNQEFTLNLGMFPTGVYFLTLKNDNRTFKTKLIKN